MTETPPLDEGTPDPPKTTAFSARLPTELVDRLDARRNGLAKPLSRNAWLEKTLDWVLTYLPTGIGHPERDAVASAAPADVAGTERLAPAKGSDYGNPAPKTAHEHVWERDGKERICHGCGEVRVDAPAKNTGVAGGTKGASPTPARQPVGKTPDDRPF